MRSSFGHVGAVWCSVESAFSMRLHWLPAANGRKHTEDVAVLKLTCGNVEAPHVVAVAKDDVRQTHRHTPYAEGLNDRGHLGQFKLCFVIAALRAKLRAHRAVRRALALLTLVRLDGVHLVDVADGTVGTLGFADLAKFGRNLVGHDDHHRVRFDVVGASGDQHFAPQKSGTGDMKMIS